MDDVFRVVHVALATMVIVFLVAIYARPALASTRSEVVSTSVCLSRFVYVPQFKYFSAPEKELLEVLLENPPL